MTRTMGLDQTCPLCGRPYADVDGPPHVSDGYTITCPNCGTYAINFKMHEFLRTKDVKAEVDRMKVAATVFERRMLEPENPDIHDDHIRLLLGPGDDRKEYHGRSLDIPPYPFRWDELLNHFPKTFSERIDRCLVLLGKLSPRPSWRIEADYTNNVRRATFSEYPDTMDFTLAALQAEGYITIHLDPRSIIVQPKGWNRIAELERERGRRWSRQGFVAMRFTGDQLEKDIKAALTKGIEAGGFKPLIVDAVQHNGKICDLIISEIRKSRFLIAEFTGHRQNVYYEAGFAQGLGMPVIWTVHEDDIKPDKVHFDTRQYNHIVWKTPDELAEKLAHRVQATIT